MIPNLGFMLFNADMIYPLGLSLVATLVVLAFKAVRTSLLDRWTLTGFLCVSLLWIALIPWSAVFLDAMQGKQVSPAWAYWPIFAVLFGWPVAAVALVYRARGARFPSALYVLLNAPGWLLGFWVSGMAVSGDWI